MPPTVDRDVNVRIYRDIHLFVLTLIVESESYATICLVPVRLKRLKSNNFMDYLETSHRNLAWFNDRHKDKQLDIHAPFQRNPFGRSPKAIFDRHYLEGVANSGALYARSGR